MNNERSREPWQLAVAVLGAAAGLGLFLVGLGALVMWCVSMPLAYPLNAV